MRIEASAPSPADLERVLASWPFKPHRWGWRGPAESLDQLFLERVQHTLEQSGVMAWSAIGPSAPTGLAVLQPLRWDSSVLALPAARLDLFVAGAYDDGRRTADALLGACVREARQQHLRHLSIRVDAADDAVIHALTANGFLNVDALMTFAGAVQDLVTAPPSGDYQFRMATPADAAAVGEIAALSIQDGRFHADPSIPSDRAADVYRTWAAACCTRSAADATILAEDATGPVAFIACRMLRDTAVHLRRATGTIPLVAASASARGQGMGMALVGAATRWFADETAVVVEVGTQLRNIAAARLYERCGFRLAAGSFSFRLMIEP